MEHFDFVIVGGGSAASVLAYRLSEGGRRTVCVLEAGPPDSNPYIKLPAGFIKTLFDPRVVWPFTYEPSWGTAGRRVSVSQGRTLGGSSSINGMIYNRGQREDFDGWAAQGAMGWSFDEVLPYFKRSETRVGEGDDHYRGRSGELPITTNNWPHPVCDAFIAANEAAGTPFNGDYNGVRQAGVSIFQTTIQRGRRVSAADAFLHPARRRANVDVRTRCQVVSIRIEGGEAQGVAYRDAAGRLCDVRADCAVVVAAGVVNSAKLLQLSGVGPAELLGSLGIEVKNNLRGVGENLRDHFSPRIVARAKDGTDTINRRVRWPYMGLEIARWLTGRPSVLRNSPALIFVAGRSRPDVERPDFTLTFAPASNKQGFIGKLEDFPGVTCGAWQMRPESKGYVRIASSDAMVDPVIQPNYLDDERDRVVLLSALKYVRARLTSPQMAHIVEAETLPGPAVQSDDEWLDFARNFGLTSYHLVGTCRMGAPDDPMAVVSPDLAVRGVEKLYVIDASVMPTTPSANTYAATLMIAEKGADILSARYR